MEGRVLTRFSISILQEASTIRAKKGFHELGTQKAGTYFTTPTLKEHSSNYAEFQKKYENTQSNLVKEVVEIAGQSPFSAWTHFKLGLILLAFLQLPISPFSRLSIP